MPRIIHINGGFLQSEGKPRAVCHCMAIVQQKHVILVDTGIGMEDVNDPERRIHPDVIKAAGFKFNAGDTIIQQLPRFEINPRDVRDIVLTHLDPDHVGGLSDFPHATVHLATEEWRAFQAGDPRYMQAQFAHRPEIKTYEPSSETVFGVEVRKVETEADIELYLLPLFGHTAGHCGVLVADGLKWVLNAGDAYYLREELFNSDHPVSVMARAVASNEAERVKSIEKLVRLSQDQTANIEVFGYHDEREFYRVLNSFKR